MNWLGDWVANTLYFRNSVVISPIDSAVYILVGTTSIVDAVDPSTSTLWDLVTPTTVAGVLSVTGSANISITGDAQNPIVNNTGVLSLIAQNGLQAQGTTRNRLLVNTGILSVSGGLGVSVAGTTVTNTGILGLTAGSGISVNGLSFDPTVSNTGVVNLVAGAGIRISELPTEPSGSSPFVSMSAPKTTRFLNENDTLDNPLIQFLDFGSVPVPNGSNPTSILFQYINGTPPDPTGSFLFDFSGWCFIIEPFGTFGLPSTRGAFFSFFDSTTQNSYTATFTTSLIGAQPPFYITIPQMFIPISAIKAAGLTRITDFVIENRFFPDGNTDYTIRLQSSAGTFATYYPTNLI
jgi:hypothetical protein